jgi:uncharacterized RDD family membrane protein YckC
MNCPVCNRNNAVTLSICPSCGAMIKDSVREELIGKISAAAKISNREVKINRMSNQSSLPNVKNSTVSSEKPVTASQINTSAIDSKLTNPTLIEFHSKNSTLPEWRLQLQNAVRQRKETVKTETTKVDSLPPKTPQRARLVTTGANALKPEAAIETKPSLHSNPDVARALQRIKDARQKFLVEEKPEPEPIAAETKSNKNFPFYIASKTTETAMPAVNTDAENAPAANNFTKPKLATSLRTGNEELDTNKLPPIPKPVQISSSFDQQQRSFVTTEPEIKVEETPKIESKIVEIEKPVEKLEAKVVEVKAEEIKAVEEVEEFDDSAPFSMRFNAGLFDLIIGSFVTALLLSPFMLLSSNWISWPGFFAFVATCAVVMFIYLTTTIGLYGRTYGMRLFSLELVDIEGENYPTFHQAAVSSSVYLLSLAFGGLGFLTIPFNEEKRAVHDIVSGTVVVREEI